MPVRTVALDSVSDPYSAHQILINLGFECFKDRHEIICCYDILTIWADHFACFGKLISLKHHSNPDDPPDVRAIFDSGYILDIEHTSTDPKHRHISNKLQKGGAILPFSGKYKTTEEVLFATNASDNGNMVSLEKEIITRSELMLAAIKAKIKKHPRGVLMVLEGDSSPYDYTLKYSMESAFAHIIDEPGAEKWIYCFISRSNCSDFYSAFFSQPLLFEERRTL